MKKIVKNLIKGIEISLFWSIWGIFLIFPWIGVYLYCNNPNSDIAFLFIMPAIITFGIPFLLPIILLGVLYEKVKEWANETN